MTAVNDGWHRRQAVAIASTLPEDINDARKILQLSVKLLDGFLSEGSISGSGDAVDANQPPQPKSSMSARTTKLWLCAALVLSIVIPSPIFQGNSIFASAKADGLTSVKACAPPG